MAKFLFLLWKRSWKGFRVECLTRHILDKGRSVESWWVGSRKMIECLFLRESLVNELV
jgi:hypothetical protein